MENELLVEYKENLHDFEKLANSAFKLSVITHGISTKFRRVFLGNYIYSEIVMTAISLLKLLPESQSSKNDNMIFWDLSSVSTLARNLVERYYEMFYNSSEVITDEEEEFRFLLWSLHASKKQKKIFNCFNSDDNSNEVSLTINKELDKSYQEIEKYKASIHNNLFFMSFNESDRKKLLKGEKHSYLSQDEINNRLGIDKDTFRAIYVFLSNCTHCLPYSVIESIEARNSGKSHERNSKLITLILQYTSSYLALAIYDYLKLFPELNQTLDRQSKELINKYLSFLVRTKSIS